MPPTATPKIVRSIMDAMECCLDHAEACTRGMTKHDRDAWRWIGDAIDSPNFRHAMVGLDRSTRRYFECLFNDVGVLLNPDEVMVDEAPQPTLFDLPSESDEVAA